MDTRSATFYCQESVGTGHTEPLSFGTRVEATQDQKEPAYLDCGLVTVSQARRSGRQRLRTHGRDQTQNSACFTINRSISGSAARHGSMEKSLWEGRVRPASHNPSGTTTCGTSARLPGDQPGGAGPGPS